MSFKIKKTVITLFSLNIYLFSLAQTGHIVPFLPRVSPQNEFADSTSILDNEWIAVGAKTEYAIGKDFSLPFNGKPSYRFELKSDDNTLQGYAKGETKGRAELSFCYATREDVAMMSQHQISNLIAAKNVYHYGKGSCDQGSEKHYRFSVYIPSSLSENVNTIFAQWHGMPDRTLLRTPDGIIKKVTLDEFSDFAEEIIFKKDTGYDKVPVKDKNGNIKSDAKGNPLYKAASKPNGWIVEQGGYPPLAFGFSNKYFYIKANSDRKWLSDKTDRCNVNPVKAEVLIPQQSAYKTSTLAYKRPFNDFPKDRWITFSIKVKWTSYGKENEQILAPGMLDVYMEYEQNASKVSEHIVDNAHILIGRNDEMGYYFKFGIYRVGNSTVPVSYNLAGYSENNY
ncbi:MAG: heparin lyase I family protein [Paludibacter sp.]|nr:heparin lyase I family protein [Paludibacter sp.]MDD4198746.1 heparin lyase I family protein [Paludibacter sp.]MDD4427735.1 heparin lyase I family protein [Paludibacter sp.]